MSRRRLTRHLVAESVEACLQASVGLRQSADISANAGDPDLYRGQTVPDLPQIGSLIINLGVDPPQIHQCQIFGFIC
jgi:hypothetical protein